MIGSTNAGGGGGTPLNFQIVGGVVQPENAKENTLWLNTSTIITDWIFDATRPPASAGRVWFSIDYISFITFNAIRNNGIQMHPIFAEQYINGVWTQVPAMIYQNGVWTNLDTDLYRSGNEFINVTGGWSGSGYSYSPDGVVGSGTKKETYIDLYSTRNAERSVCGTVNAIDLTHFRQIRVKGKVLVTNQYHGEDYGIDIYVTKTKDFRNRAVVLSVTKAGDFDVEVDIGSLSGSFYICCATASIESTRGEIYRVSLL